MNIISAYVVLVITVAGVSALETKYKTIIQGKFLTGGMRCLSEHPLSFADVMSIKNKILPDGDKPKCFIQCLFRRLEVMDDMGNMSVQGAKGTAMEVFKDNKKHMSNTEKFIDSCAHVNDQELSEDEIKKCDRAMLAFNCFVENAPKFGLDVDFAGS